MDEPFVLREEIERLGRQRDRYAVERDAALAEVTRLREALTAIITAWREAGDNDDDHALAMWPHLQAGAAALAEGSDVLPTGGAE